MFAAYSLFIFIQSAVATSGWESWANGIYEPRESTEVIYQRREVSKQATLQASHFIVRTIAAPKLDKKPYICQEYEFETVHPVMNVRCDDRGTISINLDGQPTEYKRPDGTVMKVVAQVEGAKVTQAFSGEDGGLEVVYLFSEEGLVVTKSISSTYLGQPLTVEVFYKKKRVDRSDN